MKNYEAKLLRYIMRISGFRKEDAEDALQEIFIKVYQNLRDFDSDLKFSSWVYRIAHNYVISEYRKRKIRPEKILSEEDDWQNFVSYIDVAGDVNNRINREVINNILDKIDIKYREVLILNFLEGYEYKEISDILKKPMGTVATLLNRAKKKFRQELERQNIKVK